MSGNQDIVGKVEQGLEKLKDTLGELIGGANGINARLIRAEEISKAQDRRIAYLEKVVWSLISAIILGVVGALVGRAYQV